VLLMSALTPQIRDLASFQTPVLEDRVFVSALWKSSKSLYLKADTHVVDRSSENRESSSCIAIAATKWCRVIDLPGITCKSSVLAQPVTLGSHYVSCFCRHHGHNKSTLLGIYTATAACRVLRCVTRLKLSDLHS